jgi:hypothetical protein
MNESQIYAQLMKNTLVNDEKTNWLIREGYLGEYDPAYITKKGELFIAELEKKIIEKVLAYVKLNGLISKDKLKEIASLEPDAFDIFTGRIINQHRLLAEKPGDIYIER